MGTRYFKRMAGFWPRSVVVLGLSFFACGISVCSAQKAASEELPAPLRPGSENGLSQLSPYESELPHRVTDITLQQAALTGDPPADLSTTLFAPAASRNMQRTRGWAATEYSWVPTCIAYHRLYFQEVGLERYGQTLCPCLQPLVSAGQFYGIALALPGLVVIDCPWNCLYAYGYAPAGSPCQ
jgi:hypothetical protein